MDPDVQVAFVSVMATLVATSGVVATALINRPRKSVAAEPEAEDYLDERDVLERMLSLISENERKEGTITRLRAEAAKKDKEIRRLQAENVQLMLLNRSQNE